MIVVLVLLIGFWINLMPLHTCAESALEICITMTRWCKVRVQNMWRVRLRCRMLHWIMWGGDTVHFLTLKVEVQAEVGI